MIRLVTFAASNMTKAMDLCVESAYRNGVDDVWPQNPDTIAQGFRELNEEILSAERGVGYWLWKPYFIYRAITRMKDGDILIYSDAGVEWIADVKHIIEAMDQDIFLFSNGHQHIHWCKADVMQAINGKQLDVSYQQVQASVIFFKVNEKTRKFVKEWLLFCQMPGFIDDCPSKLPNAEGFQESRHDQMILTCLAIRDGYVQHWWPDQLWYESQRYRWANDKYPSMLRHHRKRNSEW